MLYNGCVHTSAIVNSQSTVIGNHSSSTLPITAGVPKESVVEPGTFPAYTKLLGAVVCTHDVDLHLYQRKSCHITLILSDMHWLPVTFRIKYKILVLVFKCLLCQGPVYLTLLLKEYC